MPNAQRDLEAISVIKDDYEIELESGIEDESILEDPVLEKFTISSYGADYTVDTLVKRMRTGAFKIPEFQRKFVWTQKHASKFIESLLMGLPVPGIFLYKEAETNEHLVIDGQQRLKTIQSFYDGVFHERKFRLIGVRKPWLNKAYDELDSSDTLKIDDSIIHATIFKQDDPSNSLDSIYFVFERINSGGMRLSPQEIRNCVSIGKFIYLIKELNNNNDWRNIFGQINARAKDEEMIVRFFALLIDGPSYSRPMNVFLNKFVQKSNKLSDKELEAYKIIFINTMNIINKSIGKRAFRLVRNINAAVMDAVMVGIAKNADSYLNERFDGDHITKAYDALLENAEFRKSCERATADEDNVRVRTSLAISAFHKN